MTYSCIPSQSATHCRDTVGAALKAAAALRSLEQTECRRHSFGTAWDIGWARTQVRRQLLPRDRRRYVCCLFETICVRTSSLWRMVVYFGTTSTDSEVREQSCRKNVSRTFKQVAGTQPFQNDVALDYNWQLQHNNYLPSFSCDISRLQTLEEGFSQSVSCKPNRQLIFILGAVFREHCRKLPRNLTLTGLAYAIFTMVPKTGSLLKGGLSKYFRFFDRVGKYLLRSLVFT